MKHRFSLFAVGITPHGGSFLHVCAITINGIQGALLEVGWGVSPTSELSPRFYYDLFWWQLISLKV